MHKHPWRLLSAAAALSLTFALAGLASAPASFASPLRQSQDVTTYAPMVNAYSGVVCLSILNGTTVAGTQAQIFACDESKQQNWIRVEYSGGDMNDIFWIVNQVTQECLSLDGATSIPAKVRQEPCKFNDTSSEFQLWVLQGLDNGCPYVSGSGQSYEIFPYTQIQNAASLWPSGGVSAPGTFIYANSPQTPNKYLACWTIPPQISSAP
jgi:hypothetical protein